MKTASEIQRLDGLSVEDKVAAYNEFLQRFNPDAKPAFLKDGILQIPYVQLMKK